MSVSANTEVLIHVLQSDIILIRDRKCRGMCIAAWPSVGPKGVVCLLSPLRAGMCVCVEGGGWGAYFHIEAIWARSAVNSLVFEQFGLE